MAIPAISEGAHTFHVEAVDRAGNVASASVHFRVDRNPFSLTGPYDGIPLFVLLGLVLLFLLILLIEGGVVAGHPDHADLVAAYFAARRDDLRPCTAEGLLTARVGA